MRLKGKVAIVTGSSSGIGKAVAEAYGREGATVIGASRRPEYGWAVIESILEAGGSGCFVPCDVSIEKDVERLFATTIERYGRVDVLVNNAGVNFLKPFEDIETDEWDRVIGTDLRGAFFCSRHAIREMLKTGGGSIINIASVHAHACQQHDAPYAVAKWGLIGLTKALAVEFASRGIRVNAVSPGAIETQISLDNMRREPDPDAYLAWLWSNIPMGRRGAAEEVASACVYLASDEASYVTGADLLIDGGLASLLLSQR